MTDWADALDVSASLTEWRLSTERNSSVIFTSVHPLRDGDGLHSVHATILVSLDVLLPGGCAVVPHVLVVLPHSTTVRSPTVGAPPGAPTLVTISCLWWRWWSWWSWMGTTLMMTINTPRKPRKIILIFNGGAFVAIHCTFVSSSIKDFLLVLKWRSTVSIRRLGGQIYHLLRSIS